MSVTDNTTNSNNDLNKDDNTLFSEESPRKNSALEVSDTHIAIEKDFSITPDKFLFSYVDRNKVFHRIGNTWACWFNKDNIPLIVIGPHCNYL